jgi:hypothetical protein
MSESLLPHWASPSSPCESHLSESRNFDHILDCVGRHRRQWLTCLVAQWIWSRSHAVVTSFRHPSIWSQQYLLLHFPRLRAAPASYRSGTQFSHFSGFSLPDWVSRKSRALYRRCDSIRHVRARERVVWRLRLGRLWPFRAGYGVSSPLRTCRCHGHISV